MGALLSCEVSRSRPCLVAVLLLGFRHFRLREVQKVMSVLWSSKLVMWTEYFWEAGEGYSCCVTLSNCLPSLSLKDWTKVSSKPLPVHTGSSRAPVNREGSCGHSVPGSSSCLPPARNPAKWLCVFEPEDEKFPLTIEISRRKSWHTVGAQ